MSDSIAPEIAISCTEAATISRISALGDSGSLSDYLQTQENTLASVAACLLQLPVQRLYLGNEFCERLIPDIPTLQRCLTETGVQTTLLTPLASDGGLRLLRPLLERLPDGSEVVVNDWGVLHLLRRDFPHLTAIVGRLLCKMIKDPRLPTATWAGLYPSGVHSDTFRELLDSLGIRRMEMDVPPYARSTDFQTRGQQLSVHLLYGYTLKGRMCKMGSAQLPIAKRFTPGHGCRKECLSYVETTRRVQPTTQELPTFQRGNTLFYRHDQAMTTAVMEAVSQKWVDRLVFMGDWHENYRTH